MPEVQRVDEFTGEFYFNSVEECFEWCEDTSFINDEEVEEVREVVEEAEYVRRIVVRFEVPSDLWTGYCKDEPQDVRDVLKKVEERDVEDAPRSLS